MAKGGGKDDKSKKSDSSRERPGFKASRHGTGKRSSAAGNKSEQKRAAEERERAGKPAVHAADDAHTSHEKSRFLKGKRIDPRRIDGSETVADLIEGTFLAYNAARLREACQLFT